MLAYIKSLDYFGHPISLNIAKSKGAPHKTLYGGIASAIIKLTLGSILMMKIYVMFDHSDYKSNTNETIKSIEELKEIVNFKDTGIQLMIAIWTFQDGYPITFTPDDIKQYVSVRSG